ncbi:MAG: hypothetical protein KGM24_12975 [Elusimicrobia bacterium]|nr:hypothetical protein [Elusimicrobiota bacterium]
MRTLLTLAVLAVPAAAFAVPLESQSVAAGAGFARLSADVRPALTRRILAASSREPVLQPPLVPQPFRTASAPGAELLRFKLSDEFDRNLYVMNDKLGARARDVGVATDAGFKSFYLTFTDKSGTVLAPLGDLNRLRGAGVDVRIDASTVYNFRVSINIFNPIRGSTLDIAPAEGTSGPSWSLRTGSVLDAARARAQIAVIGGDEYWIFYGQDVKPGGGAFAPTRSFLFVHMNGLSSKAWPLDADSLKPGRPARVDLGGVGVWLTRTASGELVVQDDN